MLIIAMKLSWANSCLEISVGLWNPAWAVETLRLQDIKSPILYNKVSIQHLKCLGISLVIVNRALFVYHAASNQPALSEFILILLCILYISKKKHIHIYIMLREKERQVKSNFQCSGRVISRYFKLPRMAQWPWLPRPWLVFRWCYAMIWGKEWKTTWISPKLKLSDKSLKATQQIYNYKYDDRSCGDFIGIDVV